MSGRLSSSPSSSACSVTLRLVAFLLCLPPFIIERRHTPHAATIRRPARATMMLTKRLLDQCEPESDWDAAAAAPSSSPVPASRAPKSASPSKLSADPKAVPAVPSAIPPSCPVATPVTANDPATPPALSFRAWPVAPVLVRPRAAPSKLSPSSSVLLARVAEGPSSAPTSAALPPTSPCSSTKRLARSPSWSAVAWMKPVSRATFSAACLALSARSCKSPGSCRATSAPAMLAWRTCSRVSKPFSSDAF
mmetsp:Transcript_20991/g.49201  ORF Transcript_20991/g.49201 Transcript_20991/m.49201 type:complete len:250 (-) Transcript_20991:1081-1830(-)